MFFRGMFDSPAFSGHGGWLSGLGGVRSDAGQVVTPKTALALTAVQACVSLLAESIAQLPLELYQRQAGGERKPARGHPLYKILAEAPNGWQTPFEYREQTQVQLGLNGNGYSYVERNDDGSVAALYPLTTQNVEVLRGADLMPYYRIDGADPLPQRSVHHVRWFGLNSYVGLSPVLLHANAIGHAQAIQQYAGKSFANGTALSGVIERPKESPAIKEQSSVNRIVSDWEEKFTGASNAKKVALLQEGMTFRPLSMTNADAELIAVLKLMALDIARIYKVPPHMIGELDKATFSNIEHQGIQFVIYTLLPWIRRHEQAMMRDFLLPNERSEYYIEFNVSGLLRGDQKSRFDAYAIARQWGWLSANDIRRLENLPPIAGGDKYLVPLNMSDTKTQIPAATEPTKAQVAEIQGILT